MKVIGQINKYEIQRQYEYHFSWKHQREFLRECFKELVEPFAQQIEKGDKKHLRSDRKKLNMLLDIIGLLSQRGRLSVQATIEMLHERDIGIELAAQEIIELILFGIENNFFDGEQAKNTLYIVARYSLTEEKQKQYDEFQYPIPLIVEPLQSNMNGNNRGRGYYTTNSESLILGGIHHKADIDSSFLDKLSAIPLTLDVRVLKSIRNAWKSLTKDIETKSPIEYAKKLEAFERFEKHTYRISAILINQGNKYWLTHAYDKRGRVYACGYTHSYQGNSFSKACINLHRQEIITDEKLTIGLIDD